MKILYTYVVSSFNKTILLLVLALLSSSVNAETVEKFLTISTKKVNFADKDVVALAVNDSIPAPTLRFREGDEVVIHVKNNLSENASIHWHGLLLPNNMDGVPNMTYPPIKPSETFTYRFKLRQSGTYWYHSHSGLQEQRGLYGAFIIDPKEPTALDQTPDKVLVLSDWTNQLPSEVLHTLKRGSEWYSIKKESAQSILGAARLGMLSDYYSRELSRMPAMDISDVYYDAFLINGKQNAVENTSNKKIRLRVINGSASTIFYAQFADQQMTVISADGQPVVPFKIERLLIGVAESYDLIIETDPQLSREFRATSHDNVAKASLWFGNGTKVMAPDIPWPNLYRAMHPASLKSMLSITPWGAMGMSDNSSMMHHHPSMQMQHHKKPISNSNFSKSTLLSEDLSNHKDIAENGSNKRPNSPYSKLRSPNQTSFSTDKKIRKIHFTLDGDMKRYVWMIDNKVMSEADSIKINKGEVVRFIMTNRTMMYHPMHLHGHFFRVINKHGEHSPLKHTVIVAPMQTTVIEFDAEEQGDWFFHCHLLYHMMSGMARMVHYNGFNPPANVNQSMLRENPFFYMGNITALSNMSQGKLALSNARNIFSLEWQLAWQDVKDYEWEAVPLYEYYINRFWNVFAGGNLEGTKDDLSTEQLVAGFRYVLPLNIMTRNWLSTDLTYQIAFEKTFELTPRFHLTAEAEYDTEDLWELRGRASYQLSRDFALQTQWHNDYLWGAGVQLSF